MESIPCLVIGGGVVGLAIARAISRQTECCVLEQDSQPGQHTSSRNSGVIHAGIYYPPHFLKTRLCVQGNALLYRYCDEHAIEHRACGKLIVAINKAEVPALQQLQQRAAANGITLDWLDQQQIARQEPAINAVAALHSASSGIINTQQLMLQLAADISHNGSFIACQQQVTGIETHGNGFVVQINHSEQIHCQYLINAAGLRAQSIAALIGSQPIPPLYYCKGQYFSWQGESPFKQLIYPLPLADNAGLGIHATLDIAGRLRFGPDARYSKHIDYQPDDSRRMQFAEAIRHYFPQVDAARLHADYCGVRPKLSAEGQPMQDFVIQDHSVHGIQGLIHLFGIESPGLTASLAIADYVQQQVFA